MICAATPVHGESLPIAGAPVNVPWVQAAPHRAGIVGVVFAHMNTPTFALWTNGHGPNGQATKVLWIVRNVHARGSLSVSGSRLDATGAFHQTFSSVGNAQYPSIVVIPHVGCWRLDVWVGRVHGTLVVEAISP
jgi:hypothetical protein